jgi:hypothetical protein
MTEAIFSITPGGELISARYYTITRDSLNRRIISDELIEEVLLRSQDQESKDWQFTFMDLKIEILKKYDHKIEFFVSREFPEADGYCQEPLSH